MTTIDDNDDNDNDDGDMTFAALGAAMERLCSDPSGPIFRVKLDTYIVGVCGSAFYFKNALLMDSGSVPLGNVAAKRELLLRFLRQSSSFGRQGFAFKFTSQVSGPFEIPTQYFTALSGNPHLKDLSISAKLTSKELGRIVQMRSLTKLSLGAWVPLNLDLDSDESTAQLQDAFASNTTLESLDLGSRIGTDTADFLLRDAVPHSKISTLIVWEGRDGPLLSSVHAVLESTMPNLHHLDLKNFQIDGAEMEALLTRMHAHTSAVSLTIEWTRLYHTAVEALTGYMNTPMTVMSNNNSSSDNGELSNNPIQYLTIKDRGSLGLVYNALRQMLNPSPVDGVVGTIGSHHLLHLECHGDDGTHNASQLFQMLGENAARIRLQRLHLGTIDATSGAALVDSLPRWIHLKELTATLSPLRVNVRQLLGALKKNGSLHRVSTFNGQEARIAAAYCQRNRLLSPAIASTLFHDGADETDEADVDDLAIGTALALAELDGRRAPAQQFPTMGQVAMQTELTSPNALLIGLNAATIAIGRGNDDDDDDELA